jgi:hypothetical protein
MRALLAAYLTIAIVLLGYHLQRFVRSPSKAWRVFVARIARAVAWPIAGGIPLVQSFLFLLALRRVLPALRSERAFKEKDALDLARMRIFFLNEDLANRFRSMSNTPEVDRMFAMFDEMDRLVEEERRAR